MSAVGASALSTSIEWYDFLLYGVAAATVFPRRFFPESDPFIGTVLSFSTFFIGFAARPVGAAIFGHFGDRIGRRWLLIVTMLTTGLATTGIGLVPAYETIGIWGAVLLTLARVVQGISLGGAWSASVLIAGEWADPKRRGFIASFAQAGGPFGMVLANAALGLMTAVTTEPQFLDWGWRIPFLATILLVGITLYLQIGVLETPVFTLHKQSGTIARAPVAQVFKPFLYFAALDTKSALLVPLAIILALPLQDLQYGPQAAFISENFPGSLRYSGSGLGYQLASITAGGPAPILAAILLHVFGTSLAIASYMAICSAISLASVYALRDRRGTLDRL
jgi:MFS family permease